MPTNATYTPINRSATSGRVPAAAQSSRLATPRLVHTDATDTDRL
jgi:hypothetical protein